MNEDFVLKAIDKATLCMTNAYHNADYEGFIDKDILLKELGLEEMKMETGKQPEKIEVRQSLDQMSPKELKQRELGLRREDVKNRTEVIAQNEVMLAKIRADYDLHVRNKTLQMDGSIIIMNNPLEYKDSPAWADHMVKTQALNLEVAKRQQCLDAQAFDDKVKTMVDQNTRATKELKEFNKRIAVLEKKLK